MKAAAIILATVATIAAIGGTFWFGVFYGLVQNTRSHLQKLGFTKQSATLYTQAATILDDLEQANTWPRIDTAEDLLSPQTKQTITKWLTEYRKEKNTP